MNCLNVYFSSTLQMKYISQHNKPSLEACVQELRDQPGQHARPHHNKVNKYLLSSRGHCCCHLCYNYDHSVLAILLRILRSQEGLSFGQCFSPSHLPPPWGVSRAQQRSGKQVLVGREARERY